MNDVSRRIKELRDAKNLSQKKLAELAKVSQPTVYNIEHGKVENVTLKVGKNIAQALGISFGELFEIEGAGSKNAELQNRVRELENKIQDLEERLTEKNQLIQFHQRENIYFRRGNAENSISALIDFIVADEIKYRHAKTDSEKTVLNNKQSLWVRDLKYEIEKYTKEGLFTTEKIIDLFTDNDKLIYLLEKDSNSISQFVTIFTDYLNRFTNLKEQDVEIFMEKHSAFKNSLKF